jgi:hypothetical protein
MAKLKFKYMVKFEGNDYWKGFSTTEENAIKGAKKAINEFSKMRDLNSRDGMVKFKARQKKKEILANFAKFSFDVVEIKGVTKDSHGFNKEVV